MTLKSLEGNIEFKILMGAVEDIEEGGWLPCSFELVTPTKKYSSLSANEVYMSCFELSDFINGWKGIVDGLEKGEDKKYHYCNSESYFEMILESIAIDEVVEVELWINIGNYSGGKLYGYDEGIRFVVSQDNASEFTNHISKLLQKTGI